MSDFNFAGHESFVCRQFWLKKGYDHASVGLKFNDASVVSLGVGKNMVASVRYWMRAYGLLDLDDQLSDIAHKVFADKGFDPYLEDESSLWLLHYHLVIQNFASTYSLILNDLRHTKPEFTKDHFIQFVLSKYPTVNINTVGKDFDVFTKTYLSKHDDTEENYDGILSDIGLMEESKRDGKSFYAIESMDRESIPPHIILYCILHEHNNRRSISFDTLYAERNSVGVVYALTKDGLVSKLEEIAETFGGKGVVFSNHAGVKELQFKKALKPMEVLSHYYHLYAK